MQGNYNRWVIAVVVSIATFMEGLDITIANVALPHIAGGLGASPYEGTWVVSSYLIASAVIVPLAASLSEWMGRKRFYMASVAAFTVGSLLCGLAPTLPLLVVFRVVQGAAGGGLQPTEQAILADMFAESERGRAFAVYAVAAMVAPIMGPIVGGWITSNYNWRWIFFLNVPIGIVSLALSSQALQEVPQVAKTRTRPSDFVGMVYIVVGAGLLQFVLDKGEDLDWFTSAWVLLAASMVVVCFTLLWMREWRHKRPVLDVRLLGKVNFRVALIFNFLSGAVIAGSTVLLPMFLQEQLGYSPGTSGLVLFPAGILMAALMPVAAWSAEKFDPRKVIALGFLVTALGMAYSSRISLDASFATVVGMRAMQVVGLPFILIPVTTLAFVGMGRDKSMQASGLSAFSQNMGGAIGIALLTIFEVRRTALHRMVLVSNLTQTSPVFQGYLLELQSGLSRSGGGAMLAMRKAMTLMDGMVTAQASALAFVDAYWLLAVLVLMAVPLPLLMRRARNRAGSGRG